MCEGPQLPRDMFWALVLEDGKRYSQTVEQSFHISMAALELPADAEVLKGKHHQNVSVMVASQKSEFLICTLNFKHLTQQTLDLNFNEGEEVSFFINGQGTVHLTGYQLDDDNDLSDLGDFDEEEEESDTEVPQLVPSKKRKNAIEDGLPKKKTKWLTPGGTEFSDEDSDEEDEDSDDDVDDEDDEMNDTELLDMEAEENSDYDEDDDDEDDESDEEIQEQMKTPKSEAKKGHQTPKQEKTKEKQTPKPEQSKTPKPAEQKTPKQDKKEQDQKPGETPGAGGDAEAAQSGKKKKKKKKKKNKNLENGGDSPEGKMSQPNTPKPGQNTPKPGQNTPKPGQNTPKPGQNTPKPGQNQQTPKNKSEQGKTPKKQVLAGGIIAEDIKFGEGQPAKKGKMAHVYYVGKLQKDGKQFDSCTSGKPFKFKLGMGEVIQGWEKGLEGMKVGGKRRLTVPPQQGYGSQRQGPIPPNSTLVFEVELKNVS